MHFSKYFAIAAFIATGVLAAPAAEPEPNGHPKPSASKPSKPAQPTQTVVVQQNSCGNGNVPYCCNTDNYGKYTTCSAMGAGSICSATTVCCNANNSIQVCLGNVNIG